MVFFRELTEEMNQVRQIEREQTQKAETENNKTVYNYKDELTRNRQSYLDVDQKQYVEKLEAMKYLVKDNFSFLKCKQLESEKKKEDIRNETTEYQALKKTELQKIQLDAKHQMTVQTKRDTQDLKQKNIIINEREHRETMKQLIDLTFQNFGKGFNFLMSNTDYIQTFFLYTVGITSAFYLSKTSINLGGKMIYNHLGKPSLIRETSRMTLSDIPQYPMILWNRLFNKLQNKKIESEIFDDIILNSKLEENLGSIVYSVKNKRKNNAPLRNLLFYGPPGTGKTLFAKRLALNSGLDYAIMTGADVAPLGKEGVSELHQIFDWASVSKNGMILFIDEADALFRKREIKIGSSKDKSIKVSSNTDISENLRNAINAFLYRTGTPSHKIMFVLATNTPQQLDQALNDRIDQIINFPLPENQQRLQLILLFILKYFQPQKGVISRFQSMIENPSAIFVPFKNVKIDDIEQSFFEGLASQMEGFSAREIQKYIIACHDWAFSLPDPILNQYIMEDILKQSVTQNKLQLEWSKKQQSINNVAQEKANISNLN